MFPFPPHVEEEQDACNHDEGVFRRGGSWAGVGDAGAVRGSGGGVALVSCPS